MWPSGAILVALVTVEARNQDVSVGDGWVPAPERWETTSAIVLPDNRTAMLSTPSVALAAIQTGILTDNSSLSVLFGNQSDPTQVTEFRFVLQSAVAGKKTRLEATNCFVTPNDLTRHGVDPSGPLASEFEAIHFVYQNCSGAAAAASADIATEMTVSYSMLLPKDFPADSQAIMGQFHGRPDPRIFMNSAGKIARLTTAETFAACSPNRCNEGVVTGGPYDGWKYKQGGYPPLTFGVSSSLSTVPPVFAVVARSDDRIFIPKADCGFNPQDSDWPDNRKCPGGVHEQVNGVWRTNFSDYPLGQWVTFAWRVTWSRYAPEGGRTLSDGAIDLLIDGGDVANISWRGPLGRHDDGRAPFFKIGVYDPTGNTAPFNVSYKDYSQSFRILE